MTDNPTPAPTYHPRYMVPCRHWIGPTDTGSYCQATPSKQFKDGPRCRDHTPAALNGRPETKPDPAQTLDGRMAAAAQPPPEPVSAAAVAETRERLRERQAAR